MGPYAWQKEAHRGHESKQVAFGDSPGEHAEHGVASEARCRSRTPYRCDDQDELPSYLKDEDLKALRRTSDVFRSIESEKNMSFKLPKAKATAGRVLAHASMTFEGLYQKHFPMIWKIGITHCAVFRWYHKPYGYFHSFEKYQHMHVMYASPSPVGAAFLEAALIDKYRSFPAMQSMGSQGHTVKCL